MTIAHHAALLGLSTEELFLRAYQECGGFRFGLRPPLEIHALWRRGMCTAPLYVSEFLKKANAPAEQPLLI